MVDYKTKFTKASEELKEKLPGLAKRIGQMAELIGYDDEMAAARARINCESIVYDIYKIEFPDKRKSSLKDDIAFLRKNAVAPKRVIAAMNNVRELGNLSVHSVDDVETIKNDDFYSCMGSMNSLLRWYRNYKFLKPPGPPGPPEPKEIDFELCPQLLWDSFYEIPASELKSLCKKITGTSFRSKDDCLNEIYERLDTVNEFLEVLPQASLEIITDEIEVEKKKSISEQRKVILRWCKTARVNMKGVSMIYVPTINNKTFLHFSWYNEVCKLRDYSLSNISFPTVSQHKTSDITKLIKQEVPVKNKTKIEDISFWNKKTNELNLEHKIFVS